MSSCVVHKFLQNTGTLSNKYITHAVGWQTNYTNTTIYNIGSNEQT